MVEPNASNGQQKNIPILLPAVIAATASEPRELTALCKITLPIAVMEYCNPIGTPMPHSVIIYVLFICISSLLGRRISKCLIL